MSYDDDKAAEFYENPENRSNRGRAVRRTAQQRKLTNHVPIRFDADTIEQVREVAERHGATVSSWIRSLVERELAGAMSVTLGTSNSWHESAAPQHPPQEHPE